MTTLVETMTLAERLDYVLAEHGWNAGAWAKHAQLHRSHVYGLIKAAREGGDEPIRTTTYDTWRRLARAAGVAVEWLVEGIGSPDDSFIEGGLVVLSDKLSMNKRRAREAAFALELPAEAIDAGLRLPDGFSARYYFTAMEAEAERLRCAAEARARDAPVVLPTVPRKRP